MIIEHIGSIMQMIWYAAENRITNPAVRRDIAAVRAYIARHDKNNTHAPISTKYHTKVISVTNIMHMVCV